MFLIHIYYLIFVCFQLFRNSKSEIIIDTFLAISFFLVPNSGSFSPCLITIVWARYIHGEGTLKLASHSKAGWE